MLLACSCAALCPSQKRKRSESKSKSKKDDKDKPKRGITSYICFSNAKRDEVKAKYPDMKVHRNPTQRNEARLACTQHAARSTQQSREAPG